MVHSANNGRKMTAYVHELSPPADVNKSIPMINFPVIHILKDTTGCSRRSRLLAFAIPVLIAAVVISGCQKRQPSDSATAAPVTQSSARTATKSTAGSQDVTKAEGSPGGVPAKYAAYFDAGQLQRITETRNPGAGSADGEYLFRGARLVQYQGAALNNGSTIELKFDMQGSLTSATANNGENIGDEAIAAIRNRAQILRSMALARHSTQGHGK